MKFAVGNSKTGKGVVLVSRPVGISCPPKCPYLNNGCYAAATERQFPNSRKAANDNMFVSSNDIVNMIEFAKKTSRAIRIHERGDFCHHSGRLDLEYINAWKRGIQNSHNVPFIWTYTHKYLKSIAELPNVHVYASVHNSQDIKRAQRVGFKLFAFCSKIKGKNGGNPNVPTKIHVDGLGKTLVCPEQRLGRKRVNCDTCRWCVEGKGNVVFLDH